MSGVVRPLRNDRQSLYPVLMIAAGVALILGSIAWLVYSTRQSAARAASFTQAVSTPRVPYPDTHRISLQEAKASFDSGSAVFIDVRGEPYFSQGHIPGALSITENDLDSRLKDLDPSKWIITYCT